MASGRLSASISNHALHIRLMRLIEFIFSLLSALGSLPPHPSLCLPIFLFRYCYLSAGEAAVSVHRARQSQPTGHRGSTGQCQQSAGAVAEVSWQGQCCAPCLCCSSLHVPRALSTRTPILGLWPRESEGKIVSWNLLISIFKVEQEIGQEW